MENTHLDQGIHFMGAKTKFKNGRKEVEKSQDMEDYIKNKNRYILDNTIATIHWNNIKSVYEKYTKKE